MSTDIFLPKELVTDNYDDYSAESKILFAFLLTESSSAKNIFETADLVRKIGLKKVRNYKNFISEQDKQNEG